ncbi:unnamed protein product [Cunninghamella echinulata]
MTSFYDNLPVLNSWYKPNHNNKPMVKTTRRRVNFDPSPTINYYSESPNKKTHYSIKAWIPFYRHRR